MLKILKSPASLGQEEESTKTAEALSAQHSVFKKNEKYVRMNLIVDRPQPQMTEEN